MRRRFSHVRRCSLYAIANDHFTKLYGAHMTPIFKWSGQYFGFVHGETYLTVVVPIWGGSRKVKSGRVTVQAEGRGFESLRARHFFNDLEELVSLIPHECGDFCGDCARFRPILGSRSRSRGNLQAPSLFAT